MPRIFISYRRDDSSGHAGRLYDHLTDHFGQDRVFMDVDAIQPGLHFVDVVLAAVSACDGQVALIGREWLETSGSLSRDQILPHAPPLDTHYPTGLRPEIRHFHSLHPQIQGA